MIKIFSFLGQDLLSMAQNLENFRDWKYILTDVISINVFMKIMILLGPIYKSYVSVAHISVLLIPMHY